ncbi:hypothetical protein GCK72_002591 [Caenorhabditis remanei]|uniref:Doublecortin domain-containing protein n=1 Tax=Caenorhabditis remanei TaxID=31234 RepID=A0A6A5HS74_CAERE|nr:hypothetical protein GCK72_002591 [Caenorhabditis remanei]KAF1770768.1 hypothetical protein GCK72_002591 [Caenorhabditis remanei]
MYQNSQKLPVQPKNGIMKTYENPSRTFTRPYSAKTVYFYKEGDVFFTGIRVPVSQHRFKTMTTLMDELNQSMFLPYGVRRITTPMGRTNISSLDQLQHLGRYVASSSNPPKGVDLDKIQEKYSASQRRETQKQTAGGQAYWVGLYRVS